MTGPVGGLPGSVRRASELADPPELDRWLPVPAVLRPVLPGLRRGATVAVRPPASSLLLALLAAGSAAGAWSAVVGMPRLGALAAVEAGVDMRRSALVPTPGPRWPAVVAALLDGVDLVVIAPPAPVTAELASRLAARARARGSVLLPYGWWPRAEFTLTADRGRWHGLGEGHGRLGWRELTVTGYGRGAASRSRQVRVRLPGPDGRIAPVPAGAGRHRLTVIDGAGGQSIGTRADVPKGRGCHEPPQERAA